MTRASSLLALAVQDARQRDRVKGGAAAEDLLAAHHAACLAAGVAYVHKLAIPYRIVGPPRGHTRTVIFSEKPDTDYAGVMLDGTHRPIALECKSEADPGGAFYLREVKPHQRAALDRAEARGELALLAVVFGRGPTRRVFAFEWTCVRDAVALRVRDIAAWCVKPGEAYLQRWAQ